MGCGNAVGFGMALGTPVLDTLSMTGIAIQPLFGMGVRQEVLHGFAVAHFAEVASFLIAEGGRAKGQKENPEKECFALFDLGTAGTWAVRFHRYSRIRHSGERMSLPVKTGSGIQILAGRYWVPAFAGMTEPGYDAPGKRTRLRSIDARLGFPASPIDNTNSARNNSTTR